MIKKIEINLKHKAFVFLSRRDYSYNELYVKLQKYSDDLDGIKRILEDLKSKDFLSEERYINSYLRSKQSKYGMKKIRYDLAKKNIDINIIDAVIATNEHNEYDIAYKIWQRKFATVATNQKDRLRQFRFLQNRGFCLDIIIKIINNNI